MATVMDMATVTAMVTAMADIATVDMLMVVKAKRHRC